MSKDKKLKRFGRYLLLDHLVDGGMAKICRARFLSDDADKIVAIKMIQKQFSEDENFKQMFLDEIKVTFALNHPNIAQTYDYGIYSHQLYTAMEYVDGKNLKQFLDRLKERKYVFPVEISAYIISQVCQGLKYAHTFRDKLSDKKLNIIHRDISPHNIMITFDGAVKIIDFGIAKSNTNSENTQAGTIKGKLSYLAPEYLEGKDLNHQYDQFAVGITLWELLCSRKLFHSKNELAVLKQIQACKIAPPSSINPNVPKELDQIVLKALSKDRNLRFEDMDQFNRALVKFLYSNYPDFNASDLSYFAKELFKDDIRTDRAKLFEFGKIDIRPYLNDFKNESSGKAVDGPELETKELQAKREILNFDFEDIANEKSNKTKTNIALEPGRTQPGARKNAGKQDFSPNSTRMISNRMSTKTKIKNDKLKSSSNRGMMKLLVVATLGIATYIEKDLIKKEFEAHCAKYRLCSVKRAPASIRLDGRLTIRGLRGHHKLYINNKLTYYKGFFVEVPLDQSLEVKIVKDGFKPFVKTVTLTKEVPKITFSVPQELEAESFGEISAPGNYPVGTRLEFEVEGKEVSLPLPVDNYRLPAGSYDAEIENKTLGIKERVSFKVEQSKRTEIERE